MGIEIIQTWDPNSSFPKEWLEESLATTDREFLFVLSTTAGLTLIASDSMMDEKEATESLELLIGDWVKNAVKQNLCSNCKIRPVYEDGLCAECFEDGHNM